MLCFSEKKMKGMTKMIDDPKQEQMISADALKKSIAKVKKCFTSENSDYKTGYISALSVVEGMIAYLEDSGTIPE